VGKTTGLPFLVYTTAPDYSIDSRRDTMDHVETRLMRMSV